MTLTIYGYGASKWSPVSSYRVNGKHITWIPVGQNGEREFTVDGKVAVTTNMLFIITEELPVG